MSSDLVAALGGSWRAMADASAVGEPRPFRDDVVIATKFGFDTTKAGLNALSEPANIRRVVANLRHYK